MNDILYFDIPTDLFEQMLMMPKSERTHSLFIDKKGRSLDVSYFRNPEGRYKCYWRNSIGDDHSRMHVSGDVRNNLKIEPWGSDF